ncbi:DAG7 [Candida metapsilosis]|uniref:DAG7 n=1 Tax=Candida metapsilosis TaxID=273372 RepID=A0A8H8DA55_9ASCO|nr:DAG7 [Candida metapsilosis]
MRFTHFATVAALANLFTATNAAPAPGVHTVFITAFTTVVVDQNGNTHTPTLATTETAGAAGADGAAGAASSIATAANPNSAQPTTLTSQYVPPSSSSSNQWTLNTPSTTAIQSSSASPSSSQPSGSLQSGQGTYYSTGMGACGKVSTDSDYIIAISHDMYDEHNIDSNPNHNPLCGKQIRAYCQGKSVDVTVVDRCEACSYNDLDFSPSAFTQLADKSLGRIDITWEWL